MALLVGFVVFGVAMTYLVASSLVVRRAREFEPTLPAAIGSGAPRPSRGADTLTIDARDDRHWRFASLRAARILPPGDTAGWDLAVRRHRMIANGHLADAGAVPFDAVVSAAALAFEPNALGRDSSNAATNRWYRYGMMSHMLEPNGHVFVLRAHDGTHVKFEVLSYYCRGLEAGCLTLRLASLASDSTAASASSSLP